MAKISVLDKEVRLYSIKNDDYISLTDIARYKNNQISLTSPMFNLVAPDSFKVIKIS